MCVYMYVSVWLILQLTTIYFLCQLDNKRTDREKEGINKFNNQRKPVSCTCLVMQYFLTQQNQLASKSNCSTYGFLCSFFAKCKWIKVKKITSILLNIPSWRLIIIRKRWILPETCSFLCYNCYCCFLVLYVRLRQM